MLRQYKGIIVLILNPTDAVVKQTGIHRTYYTWWRTQQFLLVVQISGPRLMAFIGGQLDLREAYLHPLLLS